MYIARYMPVHGLHVAERADSKYQVNQRLAYGGGALQHTAVDWLECTDKDLLTRHESYSTGPGLLSKSPVASMTMREEETKPGHRLQKSTPCELFVLQYPMPKETAQVKCPSYHLIYIYLYLRVPGFPPNTPLPHKS